MSKAKRQMPERTGRVGVAHGEAVRDPISDEARDPLAEHQDTGSAKPKAGTGGLLEKALTRENLQVAWKRVKANKGAAGVDGLDIEQTAQAIRNRWPQIRQQLLAGRYRPSPVTASNERIDAGNSQTAVALERMNVALGAVDKVTVVLEEISTTSKEQSIGVTQINEAVTQMDTMTQQNAAMVEELAATAQSLSSQVQEVTSSMRLFRLRQGELTVSQLDAVGLRRAALPLLNE